MTKRSSRSPWAQPRDERVRVLLECRPEASPSIIASLIERDGYLVETCEGPKCTRCQLLDHGSCQLVDGADVVVNLLDTTPTERAVLDAVTNLPDPPAVVDGLGKVWTISKRQLLDDLRRALGSSAGVATTETAQVTGGDSVNRGGST